MLPVVVTCPIDSRSQHSSECDTHLFAIVPGNLQPVGAPTGVANVDGDTAVVTLFLEAFAVLL